MTGRLVLYGLLALVLALTGALGFVAGWQRGQEGAVEAYYQGSYDSCMATMIYLLMVPKGTAQGACLGFAAGQHTNGWHAQGGATGWSWEFVSGE